MPPDRTADTPHVPNTPGVTQPGGSNDDAARVREIKTSEREGRDRGASTYMDNILRSRGAFQIAVEDGAIRRWLDPRPGQVLLDAGAGVGRHALNLVPHAARVVCADFSAGALQTLEAEAARRGITTIETHVCDVCDLPFPPRSFDAALSCEVLQHIPSDADRMRALTGLHRLLRPGARFVISTLGWGRVRGRIEKESHWANGAYVFRVTHAELRTLLERAGFHDVKTRGLVVLPGHLTRHMPRALVGIERLLGGIPGLSERAVFAVGIGRA